MTARMTKRQRREQDQLKGLSPEAWNRLKQDSRPRPKLGVSDWQQRWKSGDYQRLELWQIAWELLRHSEDYWYNWAFDIGPRWAPDGSVIPQVSSDTEEWGKTYNLRQAVNPSLSAFELTENPFRSTRGQRRLRIYRGPREVNVVLGRNEVIVVMDLSWPLAPQLDAAKRHLAYRPKKSPRLRPDKYPQYVCALDGKAAGASLVEIGKVLHPNLSNTIRKDTVKNYLRAADTLGRNAYRSIARG
jgi:hypothetical protein